MNNLRGIKQLQQGVAGAATARRQAQQVKTRIPARCQALAATNGNKSTMLKTAQ